METHGVRKSKVKFHRLCSGFFPKLIKQQSQYLLGNGVTLPDEAKNALGEGFDKALQKMGLQALVDGVNWGYWQNEKKETNNATGEVINYSPGRLLVFRATEFKPLFDEYTGDMRAGIRFWQIAPDKPMQVELFEELGITKFSADENGVLGANETKAIPYVRQIKRDVTGERIIDTENQPTIPIFPLYANELKESEFTTGIKGMIDAYDYINSDLSDGITQVEGIYWVLKNFGGDDVAELLSEIQQLKAAIGDGRDVGAEPQSIEIPYQAKQIALDLLRKQIYSDFMALDTDTISGGSLTNVAINTAKTDLDLKADLFEWQVVEFVHNILKLLGITDVEATFKRRSITNDSEDIANISIMLSDGYIDEEEATYMNPKILESRQETLMKRLAIARQKEADQEFALTNDQATGTETEAIAQ